MSTKTTKYVVEIRPNFTCKEGRAILKQLNSGITVSGNVLIARDGNSTQYIAYLDEIDPAKKIGFVDGNIFDENNNAYPGQKIEEIINSNYAGTIGVVTAVDKFNVVLTVSTTTVAKATKKSANVSDEITSIVNDLVLKGIVTQDDVDERLKVMKENGVVDDIITMVFKQYRKYSEPAKRPHTVYVDPYWKNGKPSMLNAALIDALMGILMIFQGDKSVGKNVCAETVAWLLNKPVAVFTFGPDLTSDEIYGVKTTETPDIMKYSLTEIEDMAKAEIDVMRALLSSTRIGTNWQELVLDETIEKAAKFSSLKAKAPAVSIKDEVTAIIKCISEGWVLVANELNLGREDIVTQFINPLGDGTGHIIALGKKVPINEGFVFIGTQNVGDTYFGTKELNEAAASRIDRLIFNYHETIFPQLKSALVGYSINDKILEAVDNVYQTSKKLSEENPTMPSSAPISNKCLNVRGYVRALKTWATFPNATTLKDKIITNVVNNCDDDDKPQLETVLDKFIKW